MPIACCQVSLIPTASMTTSAPRWPDVILRTCSTTFEWVESTTWSAPMALAMASWVLRFPRAMTRAPIDFRTWTNIRPIGPTPMTTTVSPSSMPVSSAALMTQASGSTSAASWKLTLSGRIRRFWRTIDSGILMNSA